MTQGAMPNLPWSMSQIDALPASFLILLIGIGATLLLFWRLGDGSLATWDEAIYGRVAREMVWSGDWLTPRWNSEAWFEKPPLMMWITAAFFQLFGISEFWTRVASASCGVGTIIITYLLASNLYGSAVGAISVAVLATSEHFIWSARVGMLDTPLTLLTMLALYGYTRFESSDYRRWYVIWIACGAAIMTKSAAALIIPVTITLTVVMDRKVLRTIQSAHFWTGAVVAALLAAPWHILMFLKYGQDFFYEYVTYHILQRATTEAFGHLHTRYFVGQTLYEYFYPWCFLIPAALLFAVAEILRGQSRSRVLLLEIILVSALYTSTTNAIHWYFVPIYPALAILIAVVMVEAIRSPMGLSFWAVWLSAFLAGPAAPIKFFVLVVPCLALALAKREQTHLLAAGCALFLIVVGAYEMRPLYSRPVEPAAILASTAERKDVADRKELLLFPERLWWSAAIVAFYSDRTIQQASTVADLGALLDGGRALPILLPNSEVADVAQCCALHIQARAGDLVYGTLRKSVTNENDSGSNASSPG